LNLECEKKIEKKTEQKDKRIRLFLCWADISHLGPSQPLPLLRVWPTNSLPRQPSPRPLARLCRCGVGPARHPLTPSAHASVGLLVGQGCKKLLLSWCWVEPIHCAQKLPNRFPAIFRDMLQRTPEVVAGAGGIGFLYWPPSGINLGTGESPPSMSGRVLSASSPDAKNHATDPHLV
jgi:hypothetical protein